MQQFFDSTKTPSVTHESPSFLKEIASASAGFNAAPLGWRSWPWRLRP